MSLRPNIESLDLEGADLVIRGGSDDPLPDILRVVVTQEDDTQDGGHRVEDGLAHVEDGAAKAIGIAWKARFKNTKLKKGPAETVGIEVRADPLEVRSWFQQLDVT